VGADVARDKCDVRSPSETGDKGDHLSVTKPTGAAYRAAEEGEDRQPIRGEGDERVVAPGLFGKFVFEVTGVFADPPVGGFITDQVCDDRVLQLMDKHCGMAPDE